MAIVAWNSDIVSNKTKAFAISATSVSLTSIVSVFLFYITSALSVPPDSVNASTGNYYLCNYHNYYYYFFYYCSIIIINYTQRNG
jgi:hypothetical protein